jgi:5'-nucleotidase / UDP-sugar diphosphatase
MHLSLIHTADLHDRLSPPLADRLAELKAERGALLLDCGDAISAPNTFAWPWPERALRLMNRAGFDAMCLGNREYAWSQRGLLRKTQDAAFPVLSANILPKRGDLGHIQRWTMRSTLDGVRVGLFGLTEVMIHPGSFWDRFASTTFLPQLDAAREAVAALREQTDVLVALTHYGRAQEAQLAEAVPGIDAILCGHTHPAEPSLEMVGQTALSRTLSHAHGAVVLTLDEGVWRQEQVTR